MIGQRFAKGLFLALASVAGIVVAVAVSQVPQPARGIVVAWLLIFGTVGLLALRVLRHYFVWKAQRAEAERALPAPLPVASSEERRRPMTIVWADSAVKGRYVIR